MPLRPLFSPGVSISTTSSFTIVPGEHGGDLQFICTVYTPLQSDLHCIVNCKVASTVYFCPQVPWPVPDWPPPLAWRASHQADSYQHPAIARAGILEVNQLGLRLVKHCLQQLQFYSLFQCFFGNLKISSHLTLKLPGEGQMALPLNFNDKNIPNADFFLGKFIHFF